MCVCVCVCVCNIYIHNILYCNLLSVQYVVILQNMACVFSSFMISSCRHSFCDLFFSMLFFFSSDFLVNINDYHPELTVCWLCVWESLQSCPTLCGPMECSQPGSSVHGYSPGKNTGVGSHFFLQCWLHWLIIIFKWGLELKRHGDLVAIHHPQLYEGLMWEGIVTGAGTPVQLPSFDVKLLLYVISLAEGLKFEATYVWS